MVSASVGTFASAVQSTEPAPPVHVPVPSITSAPLIDTEEASTVPPERFSTV